MQPLAGIRVLDFSTLLPGPMATLLLAEAGAEVIKIERPGRGEEMRAYRPQFGTDSVNFALLNRGKKSIAIDLKSEGAVASLRPLVATADVVVEQFRPGVMDRLGLGYEALRAINPRIIYCAITGYGQTGARADVAAHDLNYAADAGMLSITTDASGAPVLPNALIADIAGGAYPAVMNILLALRRRDATGEGANIDIAMADSIFAFQYWAMGEGEASGRWPAPGTGLVAGGSPRYQIYRTVDGNFLAAAPLEQKFWDNFCAAIGLPLAERDDAKDPQRTKQVLAQLIATQPAAYWMDRLRGKDVCCAIAASVREAMSDPAFAARGLFDRKVTDGTRTITAVPVPIAAEFRAEEGILGYPALGADNALLGG